MQLPRSCWWKVLWQGGGQEPGHRRGRVLLLPTTEARGALRCQLGTRQVFNEKHYMPFLHTRTHAHARRYNTYEILILVSTPHLVSHTRTCRVDHAGSMPLGRKLPVPGTRSRIFGKENGALGEASVANDTPLSSSQGPWRQGLPLRELSSRPNGAPLLDFAPGPGAPGTLPCATPPVTPGSVVGGSSGALWGSPMLTPGSEDRRNHLQQQAQQQQQQGAAAWNPFRSLPFGFPPGRQVGMQLGGGGIGRGEGAVGLFGAVQGSPGLVTPGAGAYTLFDGPGGRKF
jgi:hypothetical protein